jgi:hypothetical protein
MDKNRIFINFFISEKDMKLVDKRRKTAKKENFMAWEQADKKLKHKYGV